MMLDVGFLVYLPSTMHAVAEPLCKARGNAFRWDVPGLLEDGKECAGRLASVAPALFPSLMARLPVMRL